MIQFDEGDLYYKDYINTITDDYYPDYFTIENKDTVNLKERFEMIFFCDAYLKKQKIDKNIKNFQKVEKILRARLPVRISPRKELILYVEQNWGIEESAVIENHSGNLQKNIFSLLFL